MNPIFTFSEQEDTNGDIWLIFSLYSLKNFYPIARMELCQNDKENPCWSGEVISYVPEETSIVVEPDGYDNLFKAMEAIIIAVKPDYDLNFLKLIGFEKQPQDRSHLFNEWRIAFSELEKLLKE